MKMVYISVGGAVTATKEMEIAIPVPWGHIAGKAWNDPNGLRVLFVHGLQDNAGSFDSLIPLLPDTYYCIAIDLPGHGKSSHFPKGFPFQSMNLTLAVERVVDFLAWDQFIFIGHSLGGHVGFYYSALFNDRVSKLVLLDSVVPGRSVDLTVDILVRSYRSLKDIEERVEFGKAPEYSYKGAIQRLMEGRPDPISEKAAKTLARRSLVKYGSGFRFSMDQRLKVFEGHRMGEEQIMTFLSRIKCPVLQIMTDITCKINPDVDDFQPIKAMLEKNLRQSYRYHVIEGYHSVHMDHPQKVAPLIINFLGADTKCRL